MLRAGRAGGEPRLVDHLRMPDEAQHPLRDGLGGGRHGEPLAVAAAVRVAGRVVHAPVARAALDHAELVVHHRLHPEQGQDGLDDGQVDHLSGARGVPGEQGGGHGLRGGDGGDAVGEAERGQGRRAVGFAGDGREAAHRLGEGAEAGPRRVRAELAERGDPRDDEARVDLGEHVGAEAPALQGAGAEVLDQHVGAGQETFEQVGAGGPGQVEGGAALVAAEQRPPQRHAVLGGAVAAGRIALGGMLDLDDVGAEVSEDGGGERAGEQGGHVHDGDPCQGGLRFHQPSLAALPPIWKPRYIERNSEGVEGTCRGTTCW